MKKSVKPKAKAATKKVVAPKAKAKAKAAPKAKTATAVAPAPKYLTKTAAIKAAKNKDWFRAEVRGTMCVGQVHISGGHIYLCQNDHSGSEGSTRLGWNYSWSWDDRVKKFELLDGPPKGVEAPKYVAPITTNGYIVNFHKGNIKVGCKTIKNSVVRAIAKGLIS